MLMVPTMRQFHAEKVFGQKSIYDVPLLVLHQFDDVLITDKL